MVEKIALIKIVTSSAVYFCGCLFKKIHKMASECVNNSYSMIENTKIKKNIFI